MAVTSFSLSGSTAILYHEDGARQMAYRGPGGLFRVGGSGSSPDPDPDPTPNPEPDDITITDCEGTSLLIAGNRMEWAVGIYQGAQTLDLDNALKRRAGIAGLMTALVESVLLMYANSNVPESLNYPHDAVGSDHDSLGLMQQRPSYDWGTVAELMDAEYNSRAFYGGPNGPNNGNPPGLLDKSGWESGDLGEWCQAVQVSEFPDRYSCWEAGATELYDHIASSGGGSTSGWQWPFPLSEVTSEYRPPDRPTHNGIDFGSGASNTRGTDVPCIAAGTVKTILRETDGTHGFGNGISVTHEDDTYSVYAHLYQVPNFSPGDSVDKGQTLGGVGDTGNSFGVHLHLETRLSNDSTVNPRDYMAERNATEPN